MKITAISDMHGNYDFVVPESDILCICGDIVPLNIQRHYVSSMEWFKKEFIPWCQEQPVQHVYFIGGNHDFFLESATLKEIRELLKDTNISYLIDESESFYCEKDKKEYKIYGTPWCHIFYDWAFMIPDEDMEKKFSHIPEDTDILLTHDAPFGRTDLLLQNSYFMSRGHLGNKPMLKRLEEISPAVHFTGHLHSCNHVPTQYNGTTTVCVSLLNEDYQMTYKPFTITI